MCFGRNLNNYLEMVAILQYCWQYCNIAMLHYYKFIVAMLQYRRFKILGRFPSVSVRAWVVMANNEAVRLALEKAALRAQRHAELDAAIAVMERLLNIDLLSLEMLPWGCAFRYANQKTEHHVVYDYHFTIVHICHDWWFCY